MVTTLGIFLKIFSYFCGPSIVISAHWLNVKQQHQNPCVIFHQGIRIYVPLGDHLWHFTVSPHFFAMTAGFIEERI